MVSVCSRRVMRYSSIRTPKRRLIYHHQGGTSGSPVTVMSATEKTVTIQPTRNVAPGFALSQYKAFIRINRYLLGKSSLNSSSQRSRKNNRTSSFCPSSILCRCPEPSDVSANLLSLDGSMISRSLSDGLCTQLSMVGRRVVRIHTDWGVSKPTFDRRHWMGGGKISLSACRSNSLFQPRLKFISGGKVTAHS